MAVVIVNRVPVYGGVIHEPVSKKSGLELVPVFIGGVWHSTVHGHRVAYNHVASLHLTGVVFARADSNASCRTILTGNVFEG